MSSIRHCRHRVSPSAAAALFAVALSAGPAGAQGDSASARPSVGLSSMGAITAHGGGAAVQRDFHAWAAGATADFGGVRTQRVRLIADLTYLLTLPKDVRVEREGRSYRDVFRDLSAYIGLSAHANAPTARFSPYLLAGAGVHVLSSTFGTLAIDERYNSNNFGLTAGLGTRIRVGQRLHRAVQLEVRSVHARNVRRVSVHLGLAALFNDLAGR